MKREDIANKIFVGESAMALLEMDLCDSFPNGELHHIGHDYYDESIELYFNPSVSADFMINADQAQVIFDCGFKIIYCNFTDGTEASMNIRDYPKITPRRKVDNPRWDEKSALETESEF